MYYNVTYACGHEGTVNLWGKGKDRERKLAWLTTCDCPECQAKAQAEKRAQKNTQSIAKAKEMGFPALAGTEKQVAWAETLRMEAYNLYMDYIAEAESHLTDGTYKESDRPQVVKEIETMKMVIGYMMTHANKAAEWIENRGNDGPLEMYKKYYMLMKTETADEH